MLLTNYRTLDGMKTGRMCPLPFIATLNNPNKMNAFDRGEVQNVKELFGSNWLLWPLPFSRYP